MWRVVPKLDRPIQRFNIAEQYDHYQGFKIFTGDFMYMPASASRQIAVEPTGHVKLTELLVKFKSVLVLSSGRGIFWSMAIRDLKTDIAAGELSFRIAQDEPWWASDHMMSNKDTY